MSSILKADLHVHTPLCHHAVGEMEEYVVAAIDAGLEKLAFLEHLELGIEWTRELWLTDDAFEIYFEEGRRLQKKYAKELEILLGVECGWNPEKKEELRKRLLEPCWQEIGLSCHYLKVAGRSIHLNLFTRSEEDTSFIKEFGPEKIFSIYLDSLIEAVQYLPATKLCHLDGALRHVRSLSLTPDHYKQIDALLRLVRTKGLTLEINTSGLRLRGEQFPTRTILNMAKRYNIPIVAGSDAHNPADVAGYFSTIAALLDS